MVLENENCCVDIKIENEGYRLCVENGEARVEKITISQDIPNLEHNEAQQLFFGMNNLIFPKPEFKNWLPLPFYIDSQDKF